MNFKLHYIANNLLINDDDYLEFEIKQPRIIKIQLKRPSKEEIEKGYSLSNAFCDVFTNHEPSISNNEIFSRIENNAIVYNTAETRIVLEYKYSDKWICLPNLSEFPDHFSSYINQIHLDLILAAKNIIGLIRWIKDISGSHNPFSQSQLYWSKDNIFWHPIPIGIEGFIEVQHGIRILKKEEEKLYELYNCGIGEPVYHELYREAWAQRFDNPRSALIMGIAAAEVGVKLSIGKLVPNAEWLIIESPSPSLYKILKEYWSSLPVKNKINNKARIPDSLLDLIRTGVNIRNNIVHKGDDAPQTERILQILKAIKDILLLLDYYCGFDFSYQFISQEIITELKNNQ